jgi:hypothetical protein
MGKIGGTYLLADCTRTPCSVSRRRLSSRTMFAGQQLMITPYAIFGLVVALLTIVATPLKSDTNEISHRSEFVYAGNGLVEWRIFVRNESRQLVCCFVDMRAPRFTLGNSQYVSDHRRICVYPGREEYTGLVGVTTNAAPGAPFDDHTKFRTLDQPVKIGDAQYVIRDCK